MKKSVSRTLKMMLLTLALFLFGSMTASAAAKAPMLAKAVPASETSVKITWKKVSGADRYVVYYAKCGSTLSTGSKKKTAKGSKSSLVVKKLDSTETYKFFVAAQKKSGGSYKTIAKSSEGHVALRQNKIYTNPSGISIGAGTMKIAAGDTVQLAPTVKKTAQSKKLLGHEKTARYFSTNPAVASVSAKGVVKAVKKGTCRIYAIAVNGAWSSAKVTVTAAKTKKETTVKKADTYTVSYQYVGTVPKGAPAVPAKKKYKVGTTVSAAAVPTLNGYTFSGWKGEV